MAKKAAKKKVSRELASLIGGDIKGQKPGNSRRKTRTSAPRRPAKAPAGGEEPTGSVIHEIPKDKKGKEVIPHGYRRVKDVLIIGYPRGLADIELGSRSPAVIEWYRKNHPEAYKIAYGGNVVG